MTSRKYALEIPIEGKDEISRALQQAQRQVQQASRSMDRDLQNVEQSIGEAGRAAEQAGQKIERSLSRGMQRAGQSMRTAGRAISQTGQSMTMGLTIPLAAAGLAFAKFNDVASSLQAEGQFRRSAERIGASADQMMTAIRAATGGIVDDTTLQQETTKAMALGVGKDITQVSTLWALARVQARELGGTAEQAFQRMAQAIAQGSAETLNSQGFTLRSEQIFREYAESIGTTGAELDQATRSQLVLNAVLEQGSQKLSQMDLATLDEAESLQKMTAELSNTTDSLLRNLLPVMQQVLGVFNAMPGPMKTATLALLGLGLAAGPVASAIGILTSGMGLAVKGLAALSKANIVAAVTSRVLAAGLRGVLVASGIGILIVAIGLLLVHWEFVWDGIKRITSYAVDFVKDHWDKLLVFLGPVGLIIAGILQVRKHWETIWGSIKKATATLVNPIIDIINNLIGAINKLPGVSIGKVGKIGGGDSGAVTGPIPDAHQGAITRRAGLVSVLANEAIIPLGRGGMPVVGNRIINVTNHFHDVTIREESDIDSLANRIRGSLEGVR